MNANKDAFPNEIMYPAGLTKREYAAIHIMAGFAADPATADGCLKDISAAAINWADALFEVLDK